MRIVTMMALIGVALSAAPASAATVSGGASLAPDVFDVSGLTATVSGDPNIFVRRGSATNPMTVAQAVQSSALMQLAVTNNPPGAVTGRVDYTTPDPVTAGTLFTIRSVPTGHDRDTTFTASLGGHGAIWHDPGVPDDTERLQITTLASPITTSSMAFDIELSQVSGFSDSGELFGHAPGGWIMTERQYAPIEVDPAGVSAKDPFDWNPVPNPEHLLVNKNDDGTYAWGGTDGTFNNGSSGDPYELYFDLGDAGVDDMHTVGGLLLSGRDDHHAEFDVFTGDGTNWSSASSGRVEMSERSFIVVEFDQPLTTSHLMFRMDANESWLLHKAIPLQVVPEPATLALLSVGGVLMARRRRN